ncbi:MAG: ATP-grasp domain-containing protein [Clostridium sp.]|nr:ATP-grasp domain-containing protein [Clostridium sp.]MCM1458774.1 ATP-grasp domain-containing protein [Bacteroides sp.]
MNILILSVGTKCKIVEYFKAEADKVVTTDCGAYVPAAYMSDIHYLVPAMKSSDYISKIKEICEKEAINVILPLHEDELELIAEKRACFEAMGIFVAISDTDVIRMCRDKYALYKELVKYGISCVDTYDFDAEQDLIAGLPLPVIVKERTGAGSVGMFQACDRDIIEYLVKRGRKNLIVQPYIEAEEYGVDVYVDFISGQIVEIFAKQKLRMRDGETEISKAVKDDKICELVKEISSVLELKGPIDMDILRDNDRYYLLEINPRFGGGYPHAYECGVNFMKYIINNVQGKANVPQPPNYKTGNVLLKYKEVMLVDERHICSYNKS